MADANPMDGTAGPGTPTRAEAPMGVEQPRRWPAAVALAGAILGLVFASYSTLDYVAHLDRQVHDLHCSIVPGAAPEEALESGCRAALYSPYAALLKDRVWGGVPISLFALGAFAFFASFCLYMVVGGKRVPVRAPRFLAATGVTPALASIAMAVISATELGTFCQTCIGIYAASAVLAVGALAGWWVERDRVTARPAGPAWLSSGWLFGLGLFVLAPAVLYLESVPSYTYYVSRCGELEVEEDAEEALLRIPTDRAIQPAMLVVDPLCPTCKALHERLVADGTFDQLDVTLVLMPLDSACNWNLNTPLHPGACLVSRAVICAKDDALEVLEWSYEHQEELRERAKSKDGEEKVKGMITDRFSKLDKCLDDKASRLSLDAHLRFAVEHELPLSTPQLFLDDHRLCDADLDIGLPYALSQLAPELRR